MTTGTKTRTLNPKAAVPVLLIAFVFSLVIDNGFKFMSLPIAADLGLSVTTVSLQATLAGIIIGIGAVVYAALADAFPIRRLLVIGLVLVAIGSIIGYVFQDNWPLVLTGRLIQTSGLAAAETLYVIYVTKHLPEKDQKTYLGFSTSAFQLALLFGTLTSGFVATYISWTAMFLISLLAVLAIPFALRTIPEHASLKSHLDVYGLFLIAVIATSVMLYMQAFKWYWLLPIIGGIVLFALHVRRGNALVTPEFFSNQRYVWALVVVFIVYSTQLGLTFIFPFIVNGLHGFDLDRVSLLLVPGYAAGAIVGALSGQIAKALSSRQAIILALSLIVAALLLVAFMIEGPLWVLAFAIVLFSSGFACMYAPLVNTALRDIPAEKSGIAIGFYNLTINIAIPLGIAYTAKLMDLNLRLLPGLGTATSDIAVGYASVVWIIAGIGIVGTAVYIIADRLMTSREMAVA